MPNRIQDRLMSIRRYQNLIAEIVANNPHTRRADIRITEYQIKIEKLKESIITFGTVKPLIKVTVTYHPYMGEENHTKLYDNLVTEEFYLTDVSDAEAVDYTKFRYASHKIIELNATRIALANPVIIPG